MQRLRAVLVGAGKVGLGYAADPLMARHYRYAAHAQVLAAHDRFAWVAVVDPSDEALAAARGRWSMTTAVRSVAELPADCRPDVAVIAAPAGDRVDILDGLPTVRAVLVEKPLGATRAQAEAFVARCRQRGILVQVNLWRRADTLFRRLASGLLAERIGPVEAVFGIYGNGLINNGTHMIDFVRMLAGEVSSGQVPAGARAAPAGPIPGDVNVPFSLALAGGATAMFQPVDFGHYRENAVDIWGERGRLAIYQEGLRVEVFPRAENRAMQGEREIASDRPDALPSTVGDAFYQMYSNLADALDGGAPLWSSAESALQTTAIVDAIHGQATAVAPRGAGGR